jgi:hypothetical protein|tara:strand:- start:375 stop:749 length:375 start_codon:yes stop_codon:yes gene_type:complete
MAAPNIVGISTLIGITSVFQLTNTNQTNVLQNPPSSNKVFKINTIQVTNANPSTDAYVSIGISAKAGAATTTNYLIANAGIATGTSLVVVDKASSFYLEEDKTITAQTSIANQTQIIVSYESVE